MDQDATARPHQLARTDPKVSLIAAVTVGAMANSLTIRPTISPPP